jgi:hypothetical protein
MNNIEHINPLGRDGRYHVSDLKIGDIAYLNGVEGKLTLEGNIITLEVTDGSTPSKWAIFPTVDGWIPNITGVRRPFDVRLTRAIRRIERRDRRIAGLERKIGMLEGVIAEAAAREFGVRRGREIERLVADIAKGGGL